MRACCSSSGRTGTAPLEERIERLGLADAVERHGYVDEQRFWSLLGACDVVSLRWPYSAETSAGVIRMLSLAKPIVVSDVDAFAEADEVAVKIAPDEREVDALAASLLQLVEDPSLAARMSAAARELALREHNTGESGRPLHLGARRGRRRHQRFETSCSAKWEPQPRTSASPTRARWRTLREVGLGR